MRNRFGKAIAACITGAVVFGMAQMPVEAARGVEAGVTVMLNESLAADIEAGRTEVVQAPAAICGYTNLGIAQVENHLNIREGAGEVCGNPWGDLCDSGEKSAGGICAHEGSGG